MDFTNRGSSLVNQKLINAITSNTLEILVANANVPARVGKMSKRSPIPFRFFFTFGQANIDLGKDVCLGLPFGFIEAELNRFLGCRFPK